MQRVDYQVRSVDYAVNQKKYLALWVHGPVSAVSVAFSCLMLLGKILLGLRSVVGDFGLALLTSTSRFSSYRLLYALPNILVTSFLYPGGRLALVVVRVPTWGEDLVTTWCRDPGTSTGSKQSDRTLDVESIGGVECVSRVCYGGGPLVRVVVL